MKKADVVYHLAHHVGAANGISGQALARLVVGAGATVADERKLRDVIIELRLDGEHVCAHPSHGYYMAADDAELVATCNFLYDRAMTSLRQIATMRRVSLPDLRGQLHLPT